MGKSYYSVHPYVTYTGKFLFVKMSIFRPAVYFLDLLSSNSELAYSVNRRPHNPKVVKLRPDPAAVNLQ